MEHQPNQSSVKESVDTVLTPEIKKRVMIAEALYENMSENCARRCRTALEITSTAVARLFVQNPNLSDLDLVSQK